MVHIPWKACNDVGSRVVGQHGLPGGIKNIHHIVDSFENITIPYAQGLIRRLKGELVPAAGVTLLIMIQTFEGTVERWVRFRFLDVGNRRAASMTTRKAAVDDAIVRISHFLLFLGRQLCTVTTGGHK